MTGKQPTQFVSHETNCVCLRLASLPDDTVVYPGHRYSVPSTATMAAVKEINMVFKPSTREAWLAIFGN